jgi:hypothetical protein
LYAGWESRFFMGDIYANSETGGLTG